MVKRLRRWLQTRKHEQPRLPHDPLAHELEIEARELREFDEALAVHLTNIWRSYRGE